ncbi:hypothetical protein LCGC14_2735320 [marine sediment metagenome]|uniref:Uncharacterized protein n=1 Tax=marine sediment metagenome TaxID=412755 RepID=A0A0F8ZTA7_9ZZZZ
MLRAELRYLSLLFTPELADIYSMGQKLKPLVNRMLWLSQELEREVMKAPKLEINEDLTMDAAVTEYLEVSDHLTKNAPPHGWVPHVVENIERRRAFLSKTIVDYVLQERAKK